MGSDVITRLFDDCSETSQAVADVVKTWTEYSRIRSVKETEEVVSRRINMSRNHLQFLAHGESGIDVSLTGDCSDVLDVGCIWCVHQGHYPTFDLDIN